jgi:hypothetical protein
MIFMKRTYLVCLVLIIIAGIISPDTANAQWRRRKQQTQQKEISIYDVDTVTNPIPLQRRHIHDKIDKAQKSAAADFKGIESDDTTLTNSLKEALLDEVDHIQVMIENLPYAEVQTESMQKGTYLKAVAQMLLEYNRDVNPNAAFYRKQVGNMHNLIIASHQGKQMAFIQENVNFQTLNNVKAIYSTGSPERSLIYK